ncbi:MAG: EAL domain-containing protein, partial [Ilumatobacteraceae bacterium]
LAEETGDIDAIGCWVLDTAARQATAWRRSMEHCGALWVSVNVSPVQLRSRRSRDAMQRILSDANVEAGNIVLEVTESALVADAEGGIASLHELKQQGVRIAIDDFGAGFSALSRLVRFPLDILKIDRSFISGQASGAASVLMLEAILGMADKLSLEVIAEGIERPDQYDLLRGLGCRLGQGFLLSRPVAPNVLEALLASGGLVQLPVAAAL